MTDGGNMKDKETGCYAPQHRLADLRDWLMDRIDGSEETRGEDGLISGFIAEIDALEAQIVSLTRPKTITEWVAANRYVEPTPTPQSKTQQKRFAAQSEPRGCPTPGACSAVTEQTRLRQMVEHERDSMLEKLIVHQTTIANLHDVIDGMRDAPSATATTEPVGYFQWSGKVYEQVTNNYAGDLDVIPLYAAPQSLPVEETATASGNPLLWNVHCMYQQGLRDEAWEMQWRQLLAAIEQHLQRVGYPNGGSDMKGEKP